MLDALRLADQPSTHLVGCFKNTGFTNSIWNHLNQLICFRKVQIAKTTNQSCTVLSSFLLIKRVQFAD